MPAVITLLLELMAVPASVAAMVTAAVFAVHAITFIRRAI